MTAMAGAARATLLLYRFALIAGVMARGLLQRASR
jgi:hypothetical protein